LHDSEVYYKMHLREIEHQMEEHAQHVTGRKS
jgi:hypothetical protein